MITAIRGNGQPGLGTMRFGTTFVPKPGIDSIRQVLSTFLEKGQPLILPAESEIPACVKPTFDMGIQQISPQQLDSLKNKGIFGVAEEAGDILYFLGIKAMLHAGVFSEQRALAFTKNIGNLLYADTPEALLRIHDLARQSITPQDIQTLKPYFPLSSNQTDSLLKDYLEMALVENALWSTFSGNRGQLFKLDRADTKITEETQELGEHLQRLQGHDASQLVPLLNKLNSASDFQNCFSTLQNLGRQAVKTPDFTLENLFRFTMMKSAGRTEAQYLKRTIPYDVIKAKAKAWEKILEAEIFLKQA